MVEPALSPVFVQFYNDPLYEDDWSEAISDVCLVFFRYGVGGFAEVKTPIDPLGETPAKKTYALQHYRDFVGELGGFLLFMVAITIWLPFTLLGLYLASNSDSHQHNWNDWRTAVQIKELKKTLADPNSDPKLVQTQIKTIIDQESELILTWMVEFIYTMAKYHKAQLMKTLPPEKANWVSDEVFKDLIRHYIALKDEAALTLYSVAQQSQGHRRPMIKQLMEENRGNLGPTHKNILNQWDSTFNG